MRRVFTRWWACVIASGMVILCLSPAMVKADILEDFVREGDNSSLDSPVEGDEHPRTMDNTGFTWGAYANNGTGSIRGRDGNKLFFQSGAVVVGNYAYTIFDSTGGNSADMSVDLSGPSASIEIDLARADAPPAPSYRFMVRTGPGNWYLIDPYMDAPGPGVYNQPLSGKTWTEITNGAAVLDPLAEDDEAELVLGTSGLTPDLSAVDGGGVYMDWDGADQIRQNSILWKSGGAFNWPPEVDAGVNQTIYLLEDDGVADMNATVTDDGLPNPPATIEYTWSVVSKPAGSNVTFSPNNSALNPSVEFDTEGTYELQLDASDSAVSESDTVEIIVWEKTSLVILDIPVTEDTYVNSDSPDLNYGAEGRLRLHPTERWVYMKFDPNTTIEGNIRGVILHAETRPNATYDTEVYAVTYGPSGEWFEGNANPNDGNDVDHTGVGITLNSDDLIWGDLLDSKADLVASTWYDFDVKSLVIESDGKISFGLKTNQLAGAVNNGWHAEESSLKIVYDPEQAWNPSPGDGARNVHPEAVLSWNAGTGGVTAHKVYLGTDLSALLLVDTITAGNPLSHDPTGDLSLGQEYFWRIDGVNGDANVPGGLWSFTVSETNLDVPENESPVDVSFDANAVDLPVELVWTSGARSERDDLYLSKTKAEVDNKTVAPITGVTSPLAVAGLDLEEQYFWQIVSVNDTLGRSWDGDVWGFNTDDNELIDGFEDGVWAASGGATVSAEPNIVDEGAASMRVDYDDAGGVSEATLSFALAQDWSAATGRRALRVRFHGLSGNSPEQMYLETSDGAKTARVSYDEPGDLIQESYREWQDWDIDLADLDEADLDAVTSITIGFGDGNAEGKSGTVYFDEIRAHTVRCLSYLVPGDFVGGDCIADFDEVSMLSRDWLLEPSAVTAEALDPTGLIAHFEFEEITEANQVVDTVAAWTAAVEGDATIDPAGKFGSAINLQESGRVLIGSPATVLASVSRQVTFSMWLYGYPTGIITEADGKMPNTQQIKANIEDQAAVLRLRVPNRLGVVRVSGTLPYETIAVPDAAPELWSGKWNHYAVVIDADAQFYGMYINGVLVGRNTTGMAVEPFPGSSLTGLNIPDSHPGLMDDLRIYNRVLSHGEIVTLADEASVAQPVVSEADVNDSDRVDFGDFAAMASAWLDEQLWPNL